MSADCPQARIHPGPHVFSGSYGWVRPEAPRGTAPNPGAPGSSLCLRSEAKARFSVHMWSQEGRQSQAELGALWRLDTSLVAKQLGGQARLGQTLTAMQPPPTLPLRP